MIYTACIATVTSLQPQMGDQEQKREQSVLPASSDLELSRAVHVML